MDLSHISNMKAILTLHFTDVCVPFFCTDYSVFDKIKWSWTFIKHNTQKSIAHSPSIDN